MIDPDAETGPWWKRLLWLAAIWAASAAALGIVAAFLKFWLRTR